jgi:hypothetical protein
MKTNRDDPLGSPSVGEEEIHFHIFLLRRERTQEWYENGGNARAKKMKKEEIFPLTGSGS